MSSEVKLRPEEPAEPTNVNPPGVTVSEAEALERLARLNESLRARPQPEPSPAEPEIEAPPRVRSSLRTGRIIKTLLALAAAVALLWVPVQRLLYTTSAQATVNARLINLRAPIDGTVAVLASTIAVGAQVKAGEPLLELTNPRADRQRVDDLRRTVSGLQSEVAAQTTRIEQLQKIQGDVKEQLDAFQAGRIRQLDARQAELLAEIKSAEATREDAAKSLARSTKLKEQGYQTLATLLHAERDLKVAETKVDAARKRMDSNKIELEAARKGLFVGDSYNDLPRSAQRHDEIDQQIADLTSQVEERQSRLAYLEKELATETETYERDSKATVSATVGGRIWEALTASGEEVRKGQDLLRILDCAGAVVTATVSESVYNKLWIGQPVEFTLRGESEPHAGSVAGLSGLAAAGSNFAIDQTAMTREPYHVTIAVPGLAAQKECNIGRTGSVTFEASAASTASLATSAERAFGTIALGQRAHAIAAGLAAAIGSSITYMKPRLGVS
jgi:multidrug resistance efflux pump